MSRTMENVSVSKLLSERDLIDILFHTCDVYRNGRVAVSSLISYLEKMTDTKVQHKKAVRKLSECLDPKGQNCEVDLETYRRGMCSWIELMRTQIGDDFSCDTDAGDVSPGGIPQSDMQVAVYSPRWNSFSGSHMESASTEGNTRITESEEMDLRSQVEDLQHANRRLCQENNKLQAQVDLQEDSLAVLTQDKNSLTDKIRRLQENADLQAEITAENEELKTAVGRCQEQKQKDDSHVRQLHKENASLSGQVLDLETKINSLTSEADISSRFIKELQQTVYEQKVALQEADVLKNSQEMELLEKEQALREVKTSIGKLSEMNEELRRNNEELQIHLLQTQQQLVRSSFLQQQRNVQMVVSSHDGSESDDENSEDENIRTTPFSVPVRLNVSLQSSSIHTEIKEKLQDNENSPSPLSSKEQSDMLAAEDEMWVVAGDVDMNDLLEQLTAGCTVESFMTALTKGRRTHCKKKPRTTVTATDTDSDEQHRESRTQCEERLGREDTNWDDPWTCSSGQRCKQNVNERFKYFLLKVKELKEENQRLQRLHDAAVDSVLNMEGEFYSAVASADTRIMVLRDILQEERTQKTRLQEQVHRERANVTEREKIAFFDAEVVTLKRILGIVDKKDSLEFDTVKDTLCRQQNKIEHLKRSNLELAEKYHKAELKITDLQEEAVQAAQSLEKEKHRCTKLEDAVSSSSLARQLDLRDIWRLVQKDVETEYLDKQDDSGISSSTEEVKKKIIQGIQARDNKQQQNPDFVKESPKGRPAMSLPLHRTSGHGKVNSHCCGYRCTSPGSPLVDALTIDFFNGNYYPLPKRTRATTDPYMNYLRMSCEDVDCMECRAYRLGLDLQTVASCPSLQHKLGHDLPAALGYGGFHSVVTGLDYNFNSQAGFNDQLGDRCQEMVSSSSSAFIPATAMTTSSCEVGPGSTVRSNSSSTGGFRISPAMESHSMDGSAQHRRMDFQKSNSRWTSGTSDSYASSSMDSSTSYTDFAHRTVPPGSHQSRDPAGQSDHCSSAQEQSPAGFRRMSFLAAVDKSKGKEGDWNRRPSYRAAVDPIYLTGDAGLSAGDYAQGVGLNGYSGGTPATQGDASGKAENKTVTFQLHEDDRSLGGFWSSCNHSLVSSSSLSSSSDSDSPFWGSSAVTARGSSNQPRKLSTLLEEDDAEDSQKTLTPDRRSPASSHSRSPTPTPTPLHFDFNSVPAETNGNNSPTPYLDSSDTQRSGAPALVHGPPIRSASNDMKAFLIATGEESKGMAAQPAPCNAENMPAHFKQRSELAAGPTFSPASAASASTPTPTPTSTSAASASSVASPQCFVLVPGSPPQTPRSTHDSHVPSATPSRLAKLRQTNLARKREQMKTMKMPELSEHAESDSELPPNNGTPSSGKKSTPHISVTSEDNDDKCRVDTNGETVLRPPSPSDDQVTPSIPESFLKQLGLSTADKNLDSEEPGLDQLPDKQLESRFNSLSLAFKTDRLTLEKRLGIQERSRDLAEQNIEKELQGLRDAIEVLNELCFDERVQEVISKIQNHLDTLEHSIARVSSRAEVFGAVQQEKRMCLAMDVMITFTENIRRLRDKEQADVEEARKVLNERQVTTGLSIDTFGLDRRSASVCAGLNNPRTLQRSRSSTPNPTSLSHLTDKTDMMNGSADTRRRSEVALPRFFGGTGASLHVSSSMESGFLSELSQSSLGGSARPSLTDGTEEPRQRFQSATANVTVRNVVTNTFRRASLERQKNVSLQSSSSSSSGQSASRNNSTEKSQDKEQVTKQHSQEEEAYRHGYEEGLKASLSRELTDLRDQQTSISSNLDQVMDRVETLQQEDKQESELDEAVSKVKDIVVKVRLWMSNPNWHTASHTLRKIAAGVIFLVAMVVVVITFAPLIPGNVELRNHGKPAQ